MARIKATSSTVAAHVAPQQSHAGAGSIVQLHWKRGVGLKSMVVAGIGWALLCVLFISAVSYDLGAMS